jgi:tetratricopeptide (TPR) repeat protein
MDKNSQGNHKSGAVLNWILATAITLVACGIAWVGWNCIDSLQKHAGKLDKFHVTADNTKVDSKHYDIVKNEIDGLILDDKFNPAENLQGALVKKEGSEIHYSSGKEAIYNNQYAQAAAYYSQVLAMIPEEAKHKSSWYAGGGTFDRAGYTMRVYRQRALCFRKTGDNVRAVADLTEAIRLRPDDALTIIDEQKPTTHLARKRSGTPI